MLDRDGLWECVPPSLRIVEVDAHPIDATDAPNVHTFVVTAVLPKLCLVNLIALRPELLLDDGDGRSDRDAADPEPPPSPSSSNVARIVRVEFGRGDADGAFAEVPNASQSDTLIRHFFRTGYPARLAVAARGLARCVRVTAQLGSASATAAIANAFFKRTGANGIAGLCVECFPLDECPPPSAQLRLMNAVTCLSASDYKHERAASLVMCGLAMGRARRFVQAAELVESAAQAILAAEAASGYVEYGAGFGGERTWDERYVGPLEDGDSSSAQFHVGVDGLSVQTDVSAAAVVLVLAADIHLQASNMPLFVQAVRRACETLPHVKKTAAQPLADAATSLSPVAGAFLSVARRCLGDVSPLVRGAVLRVIVSALGMLGTNVGRLFPLLARDVAFSYSHHLCLSRLATPEPQGTRSRAGSTSSTGSNSAAAEAAGGGFGDSLNHSASGSLATLAAAYETALECLHGLGPRHGGFVLAGWMDCSAPRTRRTSANGGASARGSDAENGSSQEEFENIFAAHSALFEALSPTTPTAEFHPAALIHLLRMDAEAAARAGAWCADTSFLTILLQLHDAAASRGDSECVIATTRTWREFVRHPCPPRVAGRLMRWASAMLSKWPCVPWGNARDADMDGRLRRMSTSHVVYHCNCGDSSGSASLPHGCLVLVLELVHAVGSAYNHLCVPQCAGGACAGAATSSQPIRRRRALDSARGGLCAVLFAIELCARAHLRLMASDPRKVALDMISRLWACVRLDPQLASTLLAEMLDAACVMTDGGRALPLHAAHSLRIAVDTFLPHADGTPAIPAAREPTSPAEGSGSPSPSGGQCEKCGSESDADVCPNFRQLFASMAAFLSRATDWLPGCTHDDAPALLAGLVRCLLSSGRLTESACESAIEALHHKHSVRTIAHRTALGDLARAFALPSSFVSHGRSARDGGCEGRLHTLVLVLRCCVVNSPPPAAVFEPALFSRDPPRSEREHDLYVDRLAFASECLLAAEHVAPVADGDDGLRTLYSVSCGLVDVVTRHPQSRVRELAMRVAHLAALKALRPFRDVSSPTQAVERFVVSVSGVEGGAPVTMADVFVATCKAALRHSVRGELQRRCLGTLAGVFEPGGPLHATRAPFDLWSSLVARVVPDVAALANDDWAEVRSPALALLVALAADLTDRAAAVESALPHARLAVDAYCAPGATGEPVLGELLRSPSLQARACGARIAAGLLRAEAAVRMRWESARLATESHWEVLIGDLEDVEETDHVLAERIAPLLDLAYAMFGADADVDSVRIAAPRLLPDFPESIGDDNSVVISMEGFTIPLSDDGWSLIVACNVSALRVGEGSGTNAKEPFAVSPSARLAASKQRGSAPAPPAPQGRESPRARKAAPRSPKAVAAESILEEPDGGDVLADVGFVPAVTGGAPHLMPTVPEIASERGGEGLGADFSLDDASGAVGIDSGDLGADGLKVMGAAEDAEGQESLRARDPRPSTGGGRHASRPTTAKARNGARAGGSASRERKSPGKATRTLSDSDSDDDEDVEYLYIAGELDILEEQLGDGHTPVLDDGRIASHPMTRAEALASPPASEQRTSARPQSASRVKRATPLAVSVAIANATNAWATGGADASKSPLSRRESGRGVPLTRGGAVSPDIRLPEPDDYFGVVADDGLLEDDEDSPYSVSLSEALVEMDADEGSDEDDGVGGAEAVAHASRA